jgi:hypothetical protein
MQNLSLASPRVPPGRFQQAPSIAVWLMLLTPCPMQLQPQLSHNGYTIEEIPKPGASTYR